MRLFITGGAGFIGSNFIRHWLARHDDDSVVNFDLLTYAGDAASLDDVRCAHEGRYTFVQGDIADREGVLAAMGDQRPDVVVNFASESHNSRALLDPTAFMRTNVLGTQTLLDAARTLGVGRFHHISTCEVYGDLALDSDESFSETSAYRPRTPYNASKAASDLVVRAYHESFGLATTITICSNNYGPYQHPEKLIPLFTANALMDKPLPLYRQSTHRREWLHVEDHCRAIALVVGGGTPGETYNVGSGDERSIEEIADAVLALTGRPASLKTYVPDRPGHDRRYLLDCTKIERELGWRAEVPFDDGLRATVEWYRAHQDWWVPKWQQARKAFDEFAWKAPARA